MAELALRIAGVALAWKGILDFGKLISRLTDDDERERNVLAIGLESSQQLLMDWGEHWEIDRATGRFHSLEQSRKEVIIKIIWKLCESRNLAIKRLKKRYGMFVEDDERISDRSESQLSKMVDSFAVAAKRTKKKTRWLMGDDTAMAKLVEDTMKLHDYLVQLTNMSPKFFAANFDSFRNAQTLEAGLASVERQVKQRAQQHIDAHGESAESCSLPTEESIDDQTLVGYATDSIVPSKQREDVMRHIDYSLYQYGNSRVPEAIATWWNDTQADVLILEVPDGADDEVGTSASVLLYYLVDCHKLIYVFESPSRRKPIQQLVDMVKTIIQSLVSIRGNKLLDGPTIPMGLSQMKAENMDETEISDLLRVCVQLFEGILSSTRKNVLLVVVGLEVLLWNEQGDACRLIRTFVSSLHELCNRDVDNHGVRFKPLITCKGHATSLYSCIGGASAIDLTDHSTQSASLREELALSLQM